ncbi:MAG: hypothetical protein LUC21_07775 [Oscillospiraceae bacterium]|nr:hypothetical protein [Oscillospiraceae bacterium]
MRQLRMKREQAVPVVPVTEQAVRRQLAWAAGTEFFQNRDPLYHITENFQQTFDAIGRRHAAQLAEQNANRTETAVGAPRSDDTSARYFYEQSGVGNQALLRRFSETAFQRGTLSGAVLRGSGQMMLFSCLKKTVGQSQPDKWQQRKLFENASPQRNVSEAARRKVLFNRGFTDSAVGLVVDTLRDARRVVEDMTALALGKSDMAQAGADTLITMYPFLDDSKERNLLELYRMQLDGLDEEMPQRSVLQNAAVHTEALIAKKAQMKVEFINKLRFLSDRATEALKVLEQPDFSQALDTALRDALAEEDDAGPGEDGSDGTTGTDDPQDGGTPPEGTED